MRKLKVYDDMFIFNIHVDTIKIVYKTQYSII